MPNPRVNEAVSRSYLLHRSLFDKPEKVISGSGISLTLESGEVIIDGSSGPGVACLGYNQPTIAEAVAAQIGQIAYLHFGSKYSNAPAEELASLLLSHKPGGLVKAFFVTSGSEATDAALKLATQYWHEKSQFQRTRFIARKQSFHGNTLGALSISGHDTKRKHYKDWLSRNVSFVDPCFAYRAKRENETDTQYVIRLKQQLEDEIQRLGPDTVAAFVAETVSGSTLGCVPAVPGYFKAVREVCDKHGVLLILDEVMCGMGKTGTMHAWQQEGISGPDIQTIGKALGAGFVPLSGILLNTRVFEALANGSGDIANGGTWQAHPAACAAALAVQKIIQRDHLIERVRMMGEILEKSLQDTVAPIPFVGDIRGRGLFWAVEFMADTRQKYPFPVSFGFCNRVVKAARRLGLNIFGSMGVSGKYDVELVVISPPFIITDIEIQTVVGLLGTAIKQVGQEYITAALLAKASL